MKELIVLLFSLLTVLFCPAQTDSIPFIKYTTAAMRAQLHESAIKISINRNLSGTLTDSTEADWEDAFETMEYIHYRSVFTDSKVTVAFKNIERRGTEFQHSFLEMVYAMYPSTYTRETLQLLRVTGNVKVFAMCAEYLINSNKISFKNIIQNYITQKFKNDSTGIIAALQKSMNKTSRQNFEQQNKAFHFADIFQHKYLLHNTVIYSLQSSNRNYPGIVIIKDTAGYFVTGEDGNIFSVPQLARSNSNMAGYLTNGNTPQGLFRLYGFAVSKSMAIGPTQNLQLTMPLETTVQHFLKDSTINDTIWSLALYKKLLPKNWQDYEPVTGTYYASKIGRTEIIAHGTTVDPEYYKGLSYYPQTPTQGCLCTKEIWDGSGKRIISDQQKLIDAVKKAGGANGYIIVLEIGDLQRAITINDVLPFLSK